MQQTSILLQPGKETKERVKYLQSTVCYSILVIYCLEQGEGSSLSAFIIAMQKMLIFFSEAGQWLRKPKQPRNTGFNTKLTRNPGNLLNNFILKNVEKLNY